MRAGIFYATRQGQTRKIVERIAQGLRKFGVEAEFCDVRTMRAPVEWARYRMVWVAASVHAGHHEREMIRFVRRYRDDLQRLHAVFVSVTLSEAGAEDLRAPADRRAQAARDARRMIDVFVTETGWKPACCFPVAGALAYTRYNWVIRKIMARIARQQGASTDTSVDHEFTNWPLLDRYVADVVSVTRASRA
ncbi:MAG TPA: flavodoxin domain-containing protein [Vicinamibacterales bacterium]|jgi:menaquinone-dependent protoporphyrinogen oxidase|nr:flavodoxin domain-containing protein [Vicinamibacterales bacterium]